MWGRAWVAWTAVVVTGCGTLSYYAPPATDDPDADPGGPGGPGAAGDDDGPGGGDGSAGTSAAGDDDDDDVVVDTGPGATTGGGCAYPAVAGPTGGTAGSMAAPTWLGMAFAGTVVDDAVYDYEVDGVSYSAVLLFDFFDANNQFMCEIAYDASGAIPTVGWSTDSGGALYASFDVPLANGGSSCGLVGGTDMRDVLEGFDWGFALGELRGLEAFLEGAIASQGQDWQNDWAPYTYALYAEGGLFGADNLAIEAGYARSYDRTCAVVATDGAGVPFDVPRPVSAPLDQFVATTPILITAIP